MDFISCYGRTNNAGILMKHWLNFTTTKEYQDLKENVMQEIAADDDGNLFLRTDDGYLIQASPFQDGKIKGYAIFNDIGGIHIHKTADRIKGDMSSQKILRAFNLMNATPELAAAEAANDAQCSAAALGRKGISKNIAPPTLRFESR